MRSTESALVVGSRQSELVPKLEEHLAGHVGVCSRRSGGGAVLVDGAVLWLDVLIPAEDSAASSDIGKTFLHVGAAWQRAFTAVGVATEMWVDRSERNDLAAAVCFAGRGWGELTVPTGGADGANEWTKVLGLSQRRTRWGARVQCLATFVDQVPAVSALVAGEVPAMTPEALGRRVGATTADLVALEAAALAELTRL